MSRDILYAKIGQSLIKESQALSEGLDIFQLRFRTTTPFFQE